MWTDALRIVKEYLPHKVTSSYILCRVIYENTN